MIIAVILAFASALVLSLALTLLVRALGRRNALLDSPGAAGHAKELRGVPNIGGVAIFWALVAPLLAAAAVVELNPRLLTSIVPDASIHVDGARTQLSLLLAMLGAALLLHVVGLVDDRSALPPAPKFVAQFLAAALVVLPFDVRILTLLDAHVGGPWLSIALTMLWIVVITNAMNFMDNMDGLSGGVAATAAAGLLVAALLAGQWFVAATIAVLIGALAGFLTFNFPFTERRSATIFMGDGGSLVIGFVLAVLAIRVTYVPRPDAGAPGTLLDLGAPGALAMLAPLCSLAIPLYDLVAVSFIRLSQGRSLLVGDRQHFSHRLRATGLSVRRTVLVICGCTAITGISGVLLTRAHHVQSILALLQVALVLVLLALYEHGKGWQDPSRTNPIGR